MSNYTPAPPDQFAVLEGVEHFRKANPDGVPAYANVQAWSRCWSEGPGSDPRFLDADVTALADAVILALEHVQQKALAKDLRRTKPRFQRAAQPARPAVGIR